MKRTLIPVSLILCLSTMVAMAADPLGAPKAGLNQGQFGLALEYSYTEMGLMRENLGNSGAYNIDEMHTAYLTAGYGVIDWLEVFARLGAVDAEGSNGWSFGSATFCDDYDSDFIYGAGARVTFGCLGPVTFGAVGTYSYADLDGDFDMPPFGSSFAGTVKMRIQQIQLAVGGTWNATESVAIYGGALMHHVRIKHSREANYGGTAEYVVKNDDGGSMLGGYVGAKVGLTENLYLSIEGTYTGDSKGGSASLGWNF